MAPAAAALPTRTSRAMLLVAAAASGGLAEPDILERFIHPTPRTEFLAQVHEQRWAHFPHNRSVVSIDLAQVSAWFNAPGLKVGQAVEMLPHPADQREFKAAKGRKKTLQQVQDAFLQGHSMVINSLHQWSEPGLRLATELYASVALPVDVYMYLTPPRALSYSYHSDAMDAWMVQLAGAKTWQLCGREPSGAEGDDTCSEVTMRGGDVLYVPFGLLHKATTQEELSAHLTVNVERQFYVWGALLLAVAFKVADPTLAPGAFASSGDFEMMGEAGLEKVILKTLMPKVPQLMRMPLSSEAPAEAADWLVRPLSDADVPSGYLEKVTAEFRAAAASVREVVTGKLAGKVVAFGQHRRRMGELAELWVQDAAAAAVPWALQVCRLHAVQHHARDKPARLLPVPELFSSLSAFRTHASPESSATRGQAASSEGGLAGLLRGSTLLARRREARAVLEGRAGEAAGLRLHVNADSAPMDQDSVALLTFCLGLFGPSASRGRPFRADQVPGGLPAARPLLARLLELGALRVVPANAASGDGPSLA